MPVLPGRLNPRQARVSKLVLETSVVIDFHNNLSWQTTVSKLPERLPFSGYAGQLWGGCPDHEEVVSIRVKGGNAGQPTLCNGFWQQKNKYTFPIVFVNNSIITEHFKYDLLAYFLFLVHIQYFSTFPRV